MCLITQNLILIGETQQDLNLSLLQTIFFQKETQIVNAIRSFQ